MLRPRRRPHSTKLLTLSSSDPQEVLDALVGGRAQNAFSLKRALLGLVVWLGPCPEAQLLMLDWAGVGGGRPAAILAPLAEALASFNLQARAASAPRPPRHPLFTRSTSPLDPPLDPL